jgi:hypothetical protein
MPILPAYWVVTLIVSYFTMEIGRVKGTKIPKGRSATIWIRANPRSVQIITQDQTRTKDPCDGLHNDLVVGHFEFSCFSATAQGLQPNVTYFATKNTGRAFDL